MKIAYCLLGMAVTVFCAAGPARSAEDGAPAKLKAEQLVGSWKYVSGQRDGNDLDAAHFQGQSTVISPEAFTLKGEGGEFVMKFELDGAKSPAAIEFTITEGPFGVGARTAGIVELDGDKLKLCYAAAEGARPSEFRAPAGSGNHYFVLERMPEKLDPEKLAGVWNYVRGTKDGDALDEAHFQGQSVAITKESFTLKSGETFVMKYELDAKANPATIKFTMTESPFGAGATADGVIQMKGGELSVCYSPTGGTAPTDFDAKAGSGHFLFVLKKAKAE